MLVDILFSTKHREPLLRDPEMRARMHAYLAQICNDSDSHARAVGGVADHVHILCDLSRTRSIADLVGEIKRNSSKWIKSQGREWAAFSWQNGYGAFSVSQSQLVHAMTYVREQEQHPARRTFQEEFRELLKRHEIEFDERYVWD